MLTIRKAAVIGAGNMGAQIAAHLANVGIPSLLMDIVPTELLPEEQKRGLTLKSPEVRNRVTKTLFERAQKLSPNPLFVPEAATLDRKSTRLNSSHVAISYAVFCLKKKKDNYT